MGDEPFQREPCPFRILDDCGAAFAMGAIGGSIWHAVKGYRNTPRGYQLAGMLSAVKTRAPVIGGSFAAWGVTFGACDCALVGLRQKEDPWNGIISGAVSSGMLSARQGLRPALRSAAVGGFLLGMIEGLGMVITKIMTDMNKPVMPQLPDDPLGNFSTPQAPPSSRSF
eukprot:m.62299 g.62299  ORF g.62299 m.62299 type:complete len:169 (-) comp49541_c0_seq3:254-760(-)